MKHLYILLLILAVVFSASARKRSPGMNAANVLMTDTIFVDGTETEYSKFLWLDRGANNVLLIEGSDDSTAGFASDSAIISISLVQGFPVNTDNVALLPSKAHQDSTTWPGGSDFVLDASIDVKSNCDTTGLFVRDSTKIRVAGSDSAWIRKDYVTTTKISTYGGFIYLPVIPDWSPFCAFKLTGLSGNALRGDGSKWVLRVYTLDGTIVKGK